MKGLGWFVALGIVLAWILGPWGPPSIDGAEGGAVLKAHDAEEADLAGATLASDGADRTIAVGERRELRSKVDGPSPLSQAGSDRDWIRDSSAAAAILVGTVRSENGIGLNQAKVTVKPLWAIGFDACVASATALADGRFRMIVPPGSYVLELVVPTWESVDIRESASVEASEERRADFAVPGAVVPIEVLDYRSGKPFDFARLGLTQTPSFHFRPETNGTLAAETFSVSPLSIQPGVLWFHNLESGLLTLDRIGERELLYCDVDDRDIRIVDGLAVERVRLAPQTALWIRARRGDGTPSNLTCFVHRIGGPYPKAEPTIWSVEEPEGGEHVYSYFPVDEGLYRFAPTELGLKFDPFEVLLPAFEHRYVDIVVH